MNCRILIVDDQTLLRKAIQRSLAQQPGFVIAGEASSGEEALEFLDSHEVDVALMDIHMGGMDGIQCTREINKRFTGIKVLALTMENDATYCVKMKNAGARGYLLKNSAVEDLIEAIQRVYGGHEHFPEIRENGNESRSEIQAGTEEESENADLSFSPRELAILAMMKEGRSQAAIARELGTTERALEILQRGLLGKMRKGGGIIL